MLIKQEYLVVDLKVHLAVGGHSTYILVFVACGKPSQVKLVSNDLKTQQPLDGTLISYYRYKEYIQTSLSSTISPATC